MENKILITYESTYGYIAQIANFIKDKLVERELETRVIDVKRSKDKEVYPLEQFKGIVLGVELFISAFKKLKKTFFKKDLAQYRDDSHFVAVFSTHPFMIGVLIDPPAEDEKFTRSISKKLGFTPDLCKFFNPVLDFTAFSPLKPDELKVIRSASRSRLKKHGIKLDSEGVNDFRDWDNIAAFADTFASLLK